MQWKIFILQNIMFTFFYVKNVIESYKINFVKYYPTKLITKKNLLKQQIKIAEPTQILQYLSEIRSKNK